MEGMTNEQYLDAKETLIKLIIELMKSSKDIDEAIRKVEALLTKKK